MVDKIRRLRTRTRRGLPRIRLESSPGQAIVLIALLMIALLGMTGLAVDGGGLFWLKRDAQNAADAAAMRGAHVRCQEIDADGAGGFVDGYGPGSDIVYAARQAALSNGFIHDEVNEWVYVTAADPVIYPSLPGSYNDYVMVKIIANKPSYFAHFVYQGPLQVTVVAIAQCMNGFDPDNTYALLGLAECGVCPGGGGENNVDRTGSCATITGGARSNCNCRFGSGGGSCKTGTGTIDTATCSGTIDTVGGGASVSPGPAVPNAPPVAEDPLAKLFPLEEFFPGGDYAMAALGDNPVDDPISPTNPYGGGCLADSFDLVDGGKPESCYHIVEGADISGTMNNGAGHPGPTTQYFEGIYLIKGSWEPKGTIFTGPKGATFIVYDDPVYGPGEINITAKVGDTSADPDIAIKPYIRSSMLLFGAYSNGNDFGSDICSDVINVSTSGNLWEGIVYAPEGGCSMSVADGGTVNGAIMCQRADVSGSNFFLHWDPTWLPPEPDSLSVVQ